MQTKRPDRPKLQFFSDSHIENLEREVHNVIDLIRDNRIGHRQALERLHGAKQDVILIYWHIQTLINRTQYRISHPENHYFPPNSKILEMLMQGFEDFKNGKIDGQQWESIAIKCKHRIVDETSAVVNEIQDLLRQSKKLIKQRQKSVFQKQDEDRKSNLSYSSLIDEDIIKDEPFTVIDENPDEDVLKEMEIRKDHEAKE
jgi:hypothetical protein